MGNGQMKGWPPAGVVTIVLAGGRTEEYRRPILVGDVMLLHPRHHVVKPDFFRATTVVVLRPDEILMPGHKFLVVPFRTVYKKLRKSGEAINVSSKSGYRVAPSGGRPREDPRVYPIGTIEDTNSCRPLGRNHSVVSGKEGLAGGPLATKPPAIHASSTLEKSPSTITSQSRTPRKKTQAVKVSRNARRKVSIDFEERARRRTSLQSQRLSQMLKHYESSVKIAENKSIKSGDLRKREPFKPAEIMECTKLEETVAVTKQAASLDLSVPEYESFKTPVMLSSPEEAVDSFEEVLESFESPATSDKEDGSLAAMDSPEWEQCSSEPLAPTPPAVANRCAPINDVMYRKINSPRTDSGQKQESSSQPPLQSGATSAVQCVSVGTMMRTWEHQVTRENYFSRCNTSRSLASSLDWQYMQDTLTGKIAQATQDRHTGLGQLSLSSPSGQIHFVRKEPEWSSNTSAHAIRPRRRHDVLGQQIPSSPIGQRVQQLDWSMTTSGHTISPRGRHSVLGQQLPSSPLGIKEPSRQELDRSLSKNRHAIRTSGSHNILGQQLPSSPSGQIQRIREEPEGSLTTNGNAVNQSAKYNGLGHQPPSEENPLRSPAPERSLSRRSDPQQQETNLDPVGSLQELQRFYRVGNNKFVQVKVPLEKGLFNSSVDPQAERKHFVDPVKEAESRASVQRHCPKTVVERLGNGPFKLQLSASPQVEPKAMAVPVKQPETKAAVQQQSPMTVIKTQDRLFKSSADPRVKPKALPVPVKQPEAKSKRQATVSLVDRQKCYRRNKLLHHLCFASSHTLNSPLHEPTVPASENNQKKKARVGRLKHEPTVPAFENNQEKKARVGRLKLIDHLKLGHSPEHDQKIVKQPDATKANNLPLSQFRQFPVPESVNRKDFGIARNEFFAFQLSQAIRKKYDSSALAPKDVNRMFPKTSIEDKFLKLPPVGFFRHRRIRSRSRINMVTNWKPKLSPLVEFSP